MGRRTSDCDATGGSLAQSHPRRIELHQRIAVQARTRRRVAGHGGRRLADLEEMLKLGKSVDRRGVRSRAQPRVDRLERLAVRLGRRTPPQQRRRARRKLIGIGETGEAKGGNARLVDEVAERELAELDSDRCTGLSGVSL